MDKDIIEKIDIIRERLGTSYRDAAEALEETRGDLLEALVLLEDKYEPIGEKLEHAKGEAMDRIKGVIRQGSSTKVRLKNGEETLFEVPVTWGLVGLAGTLMRKELAVLGLVGTATAISNQWTVEMVPEEEPESEGLF